MPPRYSKELNRLVVYGFQKIQPRTSPCEAACPAGNRIQAMETLLRDGKRAEAHAVLLTRNPYSGVTGRVCTHPCEGECNRQHYDEGVAIRALERFAADSPASVIMRPMPDTGKKIAIVGSGPAGMTAAFFLRLLGNAVTVYESAATLGGVPRTSIPDFRLPGGVVDRETGHILALGVNAHTNVRVGRDVDMATLMADYDACLLAVGNSIGRMLRIPGGERAVPAIDFLVESNLNRRSLKGSGVVILGGGGVAFDCAFTARRLGASTISLVFPEAPERILAPANEVRQAADENIALHPACLAQAIDDAGVHARALESFSFTAGGEMQAVFRDDREFVLPADIVVCASGLIPDLGFLGELAPKKSPRGHLLVDEYMQTTIPGLYAAGDIVTGPATVASAIGSGREAALGLHARLASLPGRPEVVFEANEDGSLGLAIKGTARQKDQHVVRFAEIENPTYHEHAPRQNTGAQQNSSLAFAEIDSGFTPEQALAEAARCIHCGHCIDCGTCVERCPNYILERGDDGPFVRYPEECWHCACCRIGCPTGSIAMEFPITMLV